MTSLFPARESLVSEIPAGDGKMVNLFYSVGVKLQQGTNVYSSTGHNFKALHCNRTFEKYHMFYSKSKNLDK